MKKFLGRIYKSGEDLVFAIGPRKSTILPLQNVIDAISQNPEATDHKILGLMRVPGLKPADIETARIYLHRFGPDLKKPVQLTAVNGAKTLLLDECIPLLATIPLTDSFGWATHVELEGLAGKGTPDWKIWNLAIQEDFPAIVTRDSDFLVISSYEKKERGPFLIHISGNVSPKSLTSLFMGYSSSIRGLMEGASHIRGCQLSVEKGCQPII